MGSVEGDDECLWLCCKIDFSVFFRKVGLLLWYLHRREIKHSQASHSSAESSLRPITNLYTLIESASIDSLCLQDTFPRGFQEDSNDIRSLTTCNMQECTSSLSHAHILSLGHSHSYITYINNRYPFILFIEALWTNKWRNLKRRGGAEHKKKSCKT